MFFKLLGYDIKNGTIKQYKKYLLSFSFFFCVALLYRLSRLSSDTVTLGNYLLFTHKGIEEYSASQTSRFELPILWLCFHIFCCFSVLHYPFDDICDFGKSVLINAGKRTTWFLSKAAWIVFSAILYFSIYLLSQIVVCLIFGDSLSFAITAEEGFFNLMFTVSDIPEFPLYIPLALFVLPFFVSTAICLLQNTASLLIKPQFSFILSITIFVVSAYRFSPVLIGNFAMVQRYEMFLSNGINIFQGIIICLAVSIFAILTGYIVFNRYDILNRE